QVVLGLTVNCARCHDHKIDPFPQKDYYRLLAFFHNIRHYGVRSAESVAQASLRPLGVPDERQVQAVAAHQQRRAAVLKEIADIEEALRPHLTGGEGDDFLYAENRPAIIRKHVPQHVSEETYSRYRTLRRERVALERNPPPALAQALCVTEK